MVVLTIEFDLNMLENIWITMFYKVSEAPNGFSKIVVHGKRPLLCFVSVYLHVWQIIWLFVYFFWLCFDCFLSPPWRQFWFYFVLALISLRFVCMIREWIDTLCNSFDYFCICSCLLFRAVFIFLILIIHIDLFSISLHFS